MGFECRIEADSVSPEGLRLTTFVVTFPRFILAEANTHRMLSRNSASSRAIPVEKRIAAVEADPFVPESFGRNQKGMQAGEALGEDEQEAARYAWMGAAEDAVKGARRLARLGVHKQLANRLLEPFAWHTAVLTATDWQNFFAQRCHEAAQPEFRTAAEMMRDAYRSHAPEALRPGEWHLPFTAEAERRTYSFDWRLVSVARCARVSYLTQDGKHDPIADLTLAERLMSARPMHASPLGHVATPDPNYPKRRAVYERWVAENGGEEERWMRGVLYSANLHGWHPFRHTVPGESVPG
jgi:thymidylate synthase ThyX